MTEEREEYSSATIGAVIIKNDLAKLTDKERVDYYLETCRSLGLNPMTRPFEYIIFNGKLTLYPRRDATEQLRSINAVSISEPHIEYNNDLVVVTVTATDRTGRTDCDLGAVSIGALKGEARANAIMKAITKAKRRVTLSLCGLGWTDESEVESIPGAIPATVNVETGEITHPAVTTSPAPPTTNGATPPPAPSGNGNKSDKSTAALPFTKKPEALLAHVNQFAQVPYENIHHLMGGVRKRLGEQWNWSVPKDDSDWLAAFDAAITYANSKQAQPESAPEQPELPTS